MSYRFFTQLDLDLVTGIGSQQLTVPTCLVMITLPEEALSLGRKQEAHRPTSSHR